MYKVRFNLGAGKMFMTWKITDPSGNHKYYQPNEVVLKMKGCNLYNNITGATKIFEGANKYVVAWVQAEEVEVLEQNQLEMAFDKVSYNPRVTPNWELNGENVDGQTFEALVSIGRELFLQ
jgi:hypothetical protein